MTVPCNLPDYVERGGEQVWRAPYRASDTTLLGLVLPADQAAIDLLLQRDLVGPSGGQLDYRCAHANVVVICADITRMASTDKVGATHGWIHEREVSLWCLVADKTAGEKLVWYLPYLFADGGHPVAGGREVYGYPKAIGFFDKGYDALFTDKGATTTVHSVGLKAFTPQTEAVPLPMLSVTRKAGAGAPQSAFAGFAQELTQALFPGGLSVNVQIPASSGGKASATITPVNAPPPSVPGPQGPWLKPIISKLGAAALLADSDELITSMIADPQLVFLKQFRDATCPTKACYQAIVEAGLSIDPLSASYDALDPALFGVTVEDWPSHPIAKELGIPASTPLTPSRAFQATLSYDVLTGLEVWRG